MKPHIEILKQARTILENPEKWTKKAFARDSEGVLVNANSKTASCFCAMGAVRKAWWDMEGVGESVSSILDNEWSHDMALQKLCKYLAENHDGISIPRFNDNPERTHADILKMFDEVIAKEQE